MPAPAWGPDSPADDRAVARNVATLLGALRSTARERVLPSIEMAHDWHRRIHVGVRSVPAPNYLGTPRGSRDPDLWDYEVVLGNPVTGLVLGRGVPAASVAGEFQGLGEAIATAVSALDAALPEGPPESTDGLLAVVELAAVMHGEWVRIHPCANGNGRIARTWANWVAMRYHLPPFVRIKPRPDGLLYAVAAHRSLGLPPDFRGHHELTVQVFLDLLRDVPR